MFYRLRDSLNRSHFNRKCNAVLTTPPLELKPGAVRVVSQVSHKDLMMYLIAIKSFYLFLGQGMVTVLDDGSLTAEDKDLLLRHVPQIDIRTFDSVELGQCPRGGTWERLCLICELSRDSYVIQLDSDTVTLRPVDEVQQAIHENVSYTIMGGGAPPNFETFAEASQRAKKMQGDHVQVHIEKGIGSLPGHENYKYARGNSAFAGFAKGSFTLAQLEQYSAMMISLVGVEKWNEWGSEQITSNLVVANTPNARPMPQRKYLGYYPERDVDYENEAILIHFIGLHRYDNGFYIRMARKMIEAYVRGNAQ